MIGIRLRALGLSLAVALLASSPGAGEEWSTAEWTKADLQEECTRRGIAFRKSWTKDELRRALASAGGPAPVARSPGRSAGGKPPKLSRAARQIVDSLTYQ